MTNNDQKNNNGPGGVGKDNTIDVDTFLHSIASGDEDNSLGLVVPHDKLLQLLQEAHSAEHYKDLAMRIQADFENFRKRTERDAEEERDVRLKSLFEKILPALEAFHLAFGHDNDWSEAETLNGVKMAFEQLTGALKEFGLKKIEAEGKKFDPSLHEVAETEASRKKPPNTVLRELRPGFTFKGMSVRPSQVVVSVPAAKKKNGKKNKDGD
ncbi:MAG: nucleotide exchange factor GrpE [Planctomycetota bacterium]|nr:nucleotide exchange factor GrpE [Planctomycetota bacterium]